jgi:beta-glucanase (GH16 family)
MEPMGRCRMRRCGNLMWAGVGAGIGSWSITRIGHECFAAWGKIGYYGAARGARRSGSCGAVVYVGEVEDAGIVCTGYGRFVARIQIPRGQGIWPAFWLLGEDIEPRGWPECGEIDVMENIGREPSTNHGSLHGPGYSGDQDFTSIFHLPGGVNLADDFHAFAMEWEPGAVRFYTDGQQYATFRPAQLPAGKKWVFDHPFFLLLNVAVGGDWPGPPDASTEFPQKMMVDWVRVYTLKERKSNR